MKYRLIPFFAAGIVFAALATPVPAARFEAGTSFTLPAEEIQVGDLYFGGNALRLDGTVEGSVLVGAQTVTLAGTITRNLFVGAQTVDITGPVQGDVLAGCATLNIADSVSGTVRVGANSVSINSRIGQDVLAGCRELVIDKDAEIRGDVITGCGTLNISGTVRGDVRADADKVIVSGIIDGDLIVTIDEQLVLTEDARVFGNLDYRSEKELDIGNPDAVFGDIEFTKKPRPREIEEFKRFRPRPSLFAAFLLPFAIFSVLGALAIGFILIAIWKHALIHALENSMSRFGRTVGFGAIGLFAAPLALLVALLLIVTIPASLIGMLLYLILRSLSKVFAGMFLGKWLFGLFGGHTASIWLFAPVGIILVYALCAIPVAGWLIWLFGAMVGFGVIIELLSSSRRP